MGRISVMPTVNADGARSFTSFNRNFAPFRIWGVIEQTIQQNFEMRRHFKKSNSPPKQGNDYARIK